MKEVEKRIERKEHILEKMLGGRSTRTVGSSGRSFLAFLGENNISPLSGG
jgi:hypothetical protein